MNTNTISNHKDSSLTSVLNMDKETTSLQYLPLGTTQNNIKENILWLNVAV